jgi:hypothetical protein
MHDKGASSVKALKRLGVYKKTLFFRFHDQEIIAGFDPPYHLKYTCKPLLKRDMVNVRFDIAVNGEHLTGPAKRTDILKVYKNDSQKLLLYITAA